MKILMIIIAVMLVYGELSVAENFIPNPDAERGIKGWKAVGDIHLARTDDGAQQGKWSFAVSGSASRKGALCGTKLRAQKVLSGAWYRLEGWLKISRLTPRIRAPFFSLTAIDAKGNVIARYRTPEYDLFTPDTWQRLSVDFELDAQVSSFGLLVLSNGIEGLHHIELSFDNLQLIPIEEIDVNEHTQGTIPPSRLTTLTRHRPRLFAQAERFQELRAQLDREPYDRFWNVIRRKAARYADEVPPVNPPPINTIDPMRSFGERLFYLAMAYSLSGDDAYLAGAKTWMEAVCSYPSWAGDQDLGAAHVLTGMAVAYDWLYAALSPQERQRYRERMIHQAGIFYELLTQETIWWQKALLQNHNYVNVAALAAAGLALLGETPEAEKYLEAAHHNFQKVVRVLPPDGSWHEGVSYWAYGGERLLMYAAIEELVWGGEPLKATPWFENTIDFRLHSSVSGFAHVLIFGDSFDIDNTAGLILRRLASVFRDGRAQWLAERVEKARNLPWQLSWLDLLWYDESVLPVSPDTWPTYAYFQNLGLFVWRSSWEDDAILWAFKAGPPLGHVAYNEFPFVTGAGHGHPDQGHFVLYADEQPLIIDDGYVYLKRTKNHNVLVGGEDCGQIGEGQKWFDDEMYRRQAASVAIEHHEITEEYTYLLANLSEAYSSSCGFERYWRHLLVLADGAAIIVDQFSLTNKQIVEWQIHFPDDFRVERRDRSMRVIHDTTGFQLDNLSSEEMSEMSVAPHSLPAQEQHPASGTYQGKRLTIGSIRPVKDGAVVVMLRPFVDSQSLSSVKAELRDNTVEVQLKERKQSLVLDISSQRAYIRK